MMLLMIILVVVGNLENDDGFIYCLYYTFLKLCHSRLMFDNGHDEEDDDDDHKGVEDDDVDDDSDKGPTLPLNLGLLYTQE